MNEFYQKTLFLKKRFLFKENGIEIEFKDSDGAFSLFINFDRILSRENVRIFTSQKKRVLRIGLGIAMLTFIRGMAAVNSEHNVLLPILIIAISIAAITLGYFYLTRLKYYAVELEDHKRFQVLYSQPSHEAVLNFLDELFERRKAYYRKQYFFIDYENSSKSEMDKMKWLFSEGIITESEFNVVSDEINEHLDA